MTKPPRPSVLLLALLAAVFGRVGWVALAFHVLGTARRHHLEAAWFIFIAGIVIVSLFRHGKDATIVPASTISPAAVIAFLAASVVLYWPALSLGLLSDDFVLLTQPVLGAWEFVRPVPLLLWRAIHPLAGPAGLHALNVGLHGLNATLVTRLAWLGPASSPPGLGPYAAGLLFLTFPASVEAVAWSSGVFDVLMVTLVLTALLLAQRASSAAQIASVAALIAALLTKETAVVAPVLLLLAAGRPRKNAVLLAWIGCVVAYVGARTLLRPVAAPLPGRIEGYFIKELLGRPFASLAVPWTRDELLRHPFVLGVFPQLLVAALLAGSVIAARATRALAPALWIVAAVVPVFGFLFISDSLEGSRYLYLAAAGWALLLSRLAAAQPAAPLPTVAAGLLAIVAALGAFGIRAHLGPWTTAAALRDRIVLQARAAHDESRCTVALFRDVPESINGAFVFRNGFSIAVDRPTTTHESATPEGCVFSWDGERFVTR